MIFANPAGAPELACDECGCRWFDRISDRCYECGAPVTPEAHAEFSAALERFRLAKAGAAEPERSGDTDREILHGGPPETAHPPRQA